MIKLILDLNKIMKYIKEYLTYFDSNLIDRANNAQKVFSELFQVNTHDKNKKLWRNILLYKELISNYAIDGIITSYTKLIEWLDHSQLERQKDDWSPTGKIVQSLIAFIEGKIVLAKKNYEIDRDLLLTIHKHLSNSNSTFRITNLIETIKNNYNFNNSISSPDDINFYLNELENFIKDESIDKEYGYIIKMCVAHYQLLNIHPFDNLNGITARLINNFMLTKFYGLETPNFSISSYLFFHRDEYFNKLQNASNKVSSFNEFIHFMISSICEACVESQKLLEDINILIDQNIKALITIFNDKFIILKSDYHSFVNNLTFTRKQFKQFLQVADNKIDYWIKYLIDKKIIKYISNSNQNKMIFNNVANYLFKMDQKLVIKS